ncbi:MAG: hypothetical protein ACOYZ6_05030 [Chloroflexota bacterium]
MKTLSKYIIGSLLALAMVLSLSSAQSVKAIPTTEQMAFRSNTWLDGYTVESEENSGVGSTTNSNDPTFLVGDDVENRQYLAILSFKTAGIPDNAVITMAKLQIEQSGSVGNPEFGALVFEVRSRFGALGLEPGDFEDPASATLTGQITHVNQLVTKLFGTGEFLYVNKLGYTQIRVRLDVDDNNNASADYGIYYSGGAVNPASRPTLIVEYYVPTNPIMRKTFRSIAAQDGFIWESTETSGVGLRVNRTGSLARVGDDNLDRQYVSIFSFNTAPLPDTAVIAWARIRVENTEMVGHTGFGSEIFEVKSPFFGVSAALLPSDFQDSASDELTGQGIHVNQYLTQVFGSGEFQFINLLGITQIRLRLSVDDNDDMSADYRICLTGEATNPNSRPTLIVDYYIP